MSKKPKRLNIFIDGSFSFSIDKEVALERGLSVGSDLSAQMIEELQRSDLIVRCRDAALHFLSYRPRSEAEVRQRLYKRGFINEIADEVINELKKNRLVDDAAFAQYWTENRQLFSPRSRKLVKMELWKKGIDAETMSEVVSELDDEANAYKAGLRKARLIDTTDYIEFYQRIFGYLKTRGFGYQVIEFTVTRLWDERNID